MELWLGMSMAPGRRILIFLLRYAMLVLVYSSCILRQDLSYSKKMVLPAIELNEHGDKHGFFPIILTVAVTLRAGRMSTLRETS